MYIHLGLVYLVGFFVFYNTLYRFFPYAWFWLAVYVGLVRFLRWKNWKSNSTLNPVADNFKIMTTLAQLEMPFLLTKSLEFALYRTYAIPSISKILAASREFETAVAKRYDDTDLLMREGMENGLESSRGHLAVARMNYIHGKYPISNEDYLYVLSVFIYEPYRWAAKYGWRPLSKAENEAQYVYYRKLGQMMNIKDIPPSFEEFEQFNIDYEQKYMRYAETNARVADPTTELFLSPFPSFVRPYARKLLIALLDDRLREAFGYENVSERWKTFARAALSVWACVGRWLLLPRPLVSAVRRTSEASCPVGSKTYKTNWTVYSNIYPNGYTIDGLGPRSMPAGNVAPVGDTR